jgi:hypothetical protein
VLGYVFGPVATRSVWMAADERFWPTWRSLSRARRRRIRRAIHRSSRLADPADRDIALQRIAGLPTYQRRALVYMRAESALGLRALGIVYLALGVSRFTYIMWLACAALAIVGLFALALVFRARERRLPDAMRANSVVGTHG